MPEDVLSALSDLIAGATSTVRSLTSGPSGENMSGSTLTAMYWSGSRLALVHIGDTRAYLFRDGGLFQITHDDSVTQSMVDAGQLTPEEAASHPQRSLLLKAVGASAAEMRGRGTGEQARCRTPDLSLLDAQAGDRYLITSDGLTNAVPVSVISGALSATRPVPRRTSVRAADRPRQRGRRP